MAECNDKKCSVHGSLKVRGNVFTGIVVSNKPSKTVIIERKITRKVPKYERYKKVRSKMSVHLPECMKAKVGDKVTFGETRKISKTKSFVVLKVESN
ncbi:MAG: 30S ribosomal protein S17 [archaeon]